MLLKKIPLTLGVEEEYQIIHPQTRDLHSYIQEFLDHADAVFPGGELKPEFLQSQVEAGTQVCRNTKEVRRELIRLRGMAAQVAAHHNLKIAAASTHPFAMWTQQEVTSAERYHKLIADLGAVARQLLIFGMHIHIGFGDWPGAKNLMIEVMNQMRYFLPHLLALSSSSPFWHGVDTGLKSYRSVVFEQLPRTGIPESFSSYGEYERFVQLLGKVGAISDKDKAPATPPDPTRIWWDIRPHPRYGTLEVRICDICTSIDDAVAIVALTQALAAKLIKLRANNMQWRHYRRHHIIENKWRALRYGINHTLVDFGLEEEVPFRHLANELLELVDDVVDDLGSRKDVEHILTMIRPDRGTSADRQLRAYRAAYETALDSGQPPETAHQQALFAVVDWLADETVAGL